MNTINTPTTRIAGEYTLATYKEDGTLVRKVGPFKNLITDIGLDMIGNGAGVDFYGTPYICPRCHVGTGNTTPVNADTTLETWLAQSGSIDGISGTATYTAGPPKTTHKSRTYTFGVGVATGSISEIGTGNAYSVNGNYLFSHALILDGNNNPTVLVVAADELLKVTYTITAYIPAAPTAQTFTIASITYTVTWYMYPDSTPGTTLPWVYPPDPWGSYRDRGGAIADSGAPSLSWDGWSTYFDQSYSYVIGSHYRDWSGTSPVNSGANRTITAVNITSPHVIMIGVFSPHVPVATGQKVDISIRTAWGRYP